MAKIVMKKLKEEVEKKGLAVSVTENGKEGKSKMIASCGFLENELRQFNREGGVTLADSVENSGRRLENKSEKVGSKRKSGEEEVQGEVLDYQEEQGLPEEQHQSGCQEAAKSGHGASKDVGFMQWR